MKKLTKIFYCNVALLLLMLLLVGCTSDTREPSTTENAGKESTSQQEETANDNEESSQTANGTDEKDSISESEGTASIPASSEKTGKKEKNPLSQYSSQEIEYARIWLQLGPNQDIDELNVLLIPAGTPLNPNDTTSGSYPEDVIQLAGSRLVDGSITYSGNGDGTINIYNVPLRWDGKYPAGEKFYKEIIENTKQAYINPSNDEKVVKLINKLNIN
jgi:hypothetical protein